MVDVLPALYALMAFMLIGAIIAVETRGLLSSVLCLGAVGLALAVVDLLLLAPDLALVQLVVEVFAVVLLIRTVLTREDTTREFVSDTLHVAVIGGMLIVLVLASFFAFQAEGGLQPFGSPLVAGELERAVEEIPGGVDLETAVASEAGEQIVERLSGKVESMPAQYLVSGVKTGAPNRVTAVLLDFRAYDTLGEATVIFTAVLGCYALLRTRGRRKT